MLVRRDFIRGGGLVLATGALAPFASRAFGRDVNPMQTQLHNYGQESDLTLADQSTLATPPSNFSSNHNYFIYGGGQPIVGLVVTIDVTEDMVAPTAMSMQLNCSSLKTADCTYQQYPTAFDPTVSPTLEVTASIENFPSKPFRWRLHNSVGLPCGPAPDPTQATCKSDLFNEHYTVGTFPGVAGDTLPAGYKISWQLLNDGAGAVTGVIYSVVDNHGRVQRAGPIQIDTFKYSHTDTTVGPQAMSPIYVVQMNLAGKNGGRHTQLTSGAGTITYAAKTPLTPLGTLPAGIAGAQTVESSNVAYAELAAAANTRIVQKFRAVLAPHGGPNAAATHQNSGLP
jgi:hypothetical protein